MQVIWPDVDTSIIHTMDYDTWRCLRDYYCCSGLCYISPESVLCCGLSWIKLVQIYPEVSTSGNIFPAKVSLGL